MDPTAKCPVQASPEAAGFDIYSHEDITITSGDQSKIGTKIALEIPEGYHGQLLVRSGYATKYRARVEAGVIDSDYRGEIFVLISNNGATDMVIHKGDRIAQILIMQDPSVSISVTQELSPTIRDKAGFGSTGLKKIKPHDDVSISNQASPPYLPSPMSITASAATMIDATNHEPICNIDLSSDPFNDTQHVEFAQQGKHPTQGLILQDSDTWNDRVQIISCQSGTAASKIRNWRSRLKFSTLLKINGIDINTVEQATSILSAIPSHASIDIQIGLQSKIPMHDDNGVPMMYFDQLHTIATHLQQIATNDNNKRIHPDETKATSSEPIRKAINILTTAKDKIVNRLAAILPKSKIHSKKLTRRKLKGTKEWQQWKESEWKQLDQYYGQEMFGEPCPLPSGANVLNLLWYYNIKDDGRLKARMVCNGKPSNKNTVIFGHTYAKSLDHVGSRVFWASCASKNFIVRGADASNAFAEADAPKIPLYVRANEPYREWWSEKMKRDPIPSNYVLPVHKALQGHPEAPRAWATLIDSILRQKLHFKPTTHEPCLYKGMFQGKEVLFLRQVDDFAVGAENEKIAIAVINEIDKYMKIDIKDLGQLERYNGVDIIQGRDYIKLNNPTYLRKIIEEHKWMIDERNTPKFPLPMIDDKKYIHSIDTATAPSNNLDKIKLQVEMNFNYRQAIGELIYAMVTCRPDISFPLIKLSQYSSNPAKVHYQAVIQIFRYLNATIDDGLIYWRSQPHQSLPLLPLPKPYKTNYETSNTTDIDSPVYLHGAVDSDWAADTTHRRSVTGLVLRLAGGTILYKTKYQDTVALSTTEAEFSAACDAGKAILYVRSILDEIGLPQKEATTLFIDNNGALMMANAQQPTRRTRHIEIKKFAILDWVQRDLMLLQRISTSDNCSDGLTKQNGRQLFYRHFDYILGKIKPEYVTCIDLQQEQDTVNETNNESTTTSDT